MTRSRFLTLVFVWTLAPLGALALGEGACRFLGYPKGRFLSVYPPNATLTMTWGAVPYRVRTNSLGLRGPEIPTEKAAGRRRILALGDSVTDGFFADDEDTYPAQLETLLRARGVDAEVVNAGMGACSIDAEAATLAGLMGLRPDVVVLTFVTNDIREIVGKRREDLASLRPASRVAPADRPLPPAARVAQWLVVHSGLGEVVLDSYLKARFETYRAAEEVDAESQLTPERYRIPGGDRFAQNATLFLQRYADSDGILLERPLSASTRAAVDDYLFALGRVATFCRSHRATLVFVYFPCYAQIYDPNVSMKIRNVLERACAQTATPFLDLTPAFREAGRSCVLHLAPLDFHPNPAGNGVIAEALADFLLARGFL
jgi:lysophospholipase L1-like esterase